MTAFTSDNVSGIHPRVFSALSAENDGYRMPYGNDLLSQQLDEAFSSVFERPVAVIPCTSGTAANAIALSLMAGPINSVLVHQQSHVYVDECNAPEFYSNARLEPLKGENCKIDLQEIDRLATTLGQAHSPQPSAISITQSNEVGLVHSLEELRHLCERSNKYGLKVHMDGARFANAVASLQCSPAEMTWQLGVDILSFGATKNGCMAAEAIVLFDTQLIEQAKFRQKRAGQLLSKQRFLAAQLLAYLKDDLWLENARIGNRQMQQLAVKLKRIEGVSLPDSIDSNMMFAKFTQAQNQALERAGLAGYIYEDGRMRLVCSWATQTAEIDQFVACVEQASGMDSENE